MDPHLEDVALWPSFQHAFVACIREALQPGLPDLYQSRLRERRYQEQGEQCEEYLEIVCRSDEQLVTLLDVVSPSNKTSVAGREEALRTRRQAQEVGANVVELDLVLQGRPLLEYSRDGLPAWDYAVTVMRASHPERYEIYTSTLQKRLPRFRVPLAGTDPDRVLDLQAAFGRCYERANFCARISYQEPPAALHERIATAAYYLWQQEGCPEGRDKEHWYAATERLRRSTEAG
jgi:hypothetical protein